MGELGHEHKTKIYFPGNTASNLDAQGNTTMAVLSSTLHFENISEFSGARPHKESKKASQIIQK